MPHPTIVRIGQIKGNIDLAHVVMSDGSYRFRSKADLPEDLVVAYYKELEGEVKDMQIEDINAIANINNRRQS
jgi:uncharacterized protein (DUF3820 family)